MVQRIEAGMPQAHVARQMGLSRCTVAKRYRRWCEEGEAGLVDRSSRPYRSPRRTAARLDQRICRLRRTTRRGPVHLSARTGVPASTIWRILQHNGLNRLSWIDRPTGRVRRGYERSSPGELVHFDVKNVGQIPPGRGCRIHGRGSEQARRSKRRAVGYTYLHVAIDDYSRVAYVEAHDDEAAATLVGFWRRAQGWLWSNGIPVDGPYRQRRELRLRHVRRGCSPNGASCTAGPGSIRPQTNGKAERFNRTLSDEVLYKFNFRSEAERRPRLKRWVHDYNYHRHHPAVGGPPASRANNLTRTDT